MKERAEQNTGNPAHDLECDAMCVAARQMAALGHPARVSILCHLAGRECCCKDVVGHLDLAQSTVSQHLKVLVDAGLVRCKPDGQRSRYTIDSEAVSRFTASVNHLLAPCCAGAGITLPA